MRTTYAKLVFLSIAFLAMSSVYLWATNEGAGDPWAFMTIGTGARAMGLGGAFVAIADDATATYWNPAGLGFITGPEATFMHIGASAGSPDPTAEGIAGRHEFFSGALTSGYGNIGISVNYFNIGGIQYTIGGPATGQYIELSDANQQDTEMAYALSYALPVAWPTDKKWWSLGFTGRRMGQRFFGISTGSWGIDLGFLVRKESWLVLKNIKSGYVFQVNAGRSWKDTEDRPDIDTEGYDVGVPDDEGGFTSWRWGLALDPLDNEQMTWTLAFTVVDRRKGSPPVLSMGTEVWLLNKMVALRAGIDDWRVYKRNASDAVWEATGYRGRFTGGVGLRIPFAQVDYAVSLEPLAMKHRISLTLRLPGE